MHFKIKVINNNHSCDNDWRKGTGQCKFITLSPFFQIICPQMETNKKARMDGKMEFMEACVISTMKYEYIQCVRMK